MTKDEAKKIENAARDWVSCSAEYHSDLLLNQNEVPYSDLVEQEKDFLAILNSMIEEPKTNLIETHATHYATTTTYIIRCPICHTKSEWAEPGDRVAFQTPAELAAEIAQCQAAYLAKKPE